MSSARAAAALLALAVASCEAPVAEVVLVVRADAALAPRLRAVRVEARRRGAATALLDRTFAIAQNPLPGRVALIAADPDDARPLEVSVIADVGDPGRGDFTHRLVTRFQKNAVLYVDVPLADACTREMTRTDCATLGLTCGEAGDCVALERPGAATPPVVDAGAPDGPRVCRGPAAGPAPTEVPRCQRPLLDALERCGDGLDNDCDGRADDGCCARSCAGATGAEAGHCDEVAVAGGAMTLGEPGATPETPAASPAVRDITVSAFRMDAYEVTVARFRRFVAAGMPPPPAHAVMLQHEITLYPEAGTVWPVVAPDLPNVPRGDGTPTDAFCNWSTAPGAWESDPINCVDWYTAMAFCVWDGGRLPTEAEWEFAARYRPLRDDTRNDLRPGRRYPWGDRPPTCDDANFNECDVAYPRTTRPVGTRANGVGAQPPWLGIFDLAGNVEEFTIDHYASYAGDCWSMPELMRFYRADPVCLPPRVTLPDTRPHHPLCRGGYSGSREPNVRSASRVETSRTQKERDKGFRCVRLP